MSNFTLQPQVRNYRMSQFSSIIWDNYIVADRDPFSC